MGMTIGIVKITGPGVSLKLYRYSPPNSIPVLDPAISKTKLIKNVVTIKRNIFNHPQKRDP